MNDIILTVIMPYVQYHKTILTIKFMIGDIFHFDSTDAQKVLEIIRSDIDYDYKQSTKFTSIIKGIIEKVRGP